MTRLLIIAHDRVGDSMAGPGIRAWEIARAVVRAGHVVTLAGPVDSHTPGAGRGRGPLLGPEASPSADQTVDVIRYGPTGDTLREAAAEADVVLVQSLVLANHPFLGALAVPIVCDLYDPFVLENLPARADMAPTRRAQRDEGDREALAALLKRGDFFLCASETQRDFWMGALAASGRINPATYERDATFRALIDLVPFGIPPEPPEPPQSMPPGIDPSDATVMKGGVDGIGPTDRVVLWGGGIWNWLDPITLLQAAETLSARRPIRVVFLGTRSPSPHAEVSEAAVAARAYAAERGLTDRVAFFLEGWVPYAERGRYLLEADVAVSCHRPLVEARYAFRTRLLDCIWAGLPIVCTGGDTLADAVQSGGLGEVVPPSEPAALAAAIGRVLDRLEAGGRAAYEPAFAAVRPAYTWDRAVEPLVRFLDEPRNAPDLAVWAPTPPTPIGRLPGVAARIWREEGALAVVEEAARYFRWRTR